VRHSAGAEQLRGLADLRLGQNVGQVGLTSDKAGTGKFQALAVGYAQDEEGPGR
jgi:hypothetical protein